MLEKRHHELRTVLQAAPVTLKSPSTIEALACCEFIALLTQCLIERELRTAMTNHNVTDLALYHEGRPSRAPTAARVFDLYAETTRNHLTQASKTIQIFEPDLTPLQCKVLDLLAIPQNGTGWGRSGRERRRRSTRLGRHRRRRWRRLRID
jgi:hypothetical protein